ncbi:MAG: hypothetical protein HC842_05630 [Cytophagales bacterium]|nr:hypothetical protein [Cytophagales bacterium]
MIDRLRYQTEESKEAIAQQNSAIEQLREDVKGNQEEIDDIIQQLQASPAGAYTPRGELSSEEMESESAPEGSKYYVIVGAFKSLKYAKVFQNIFRRETGNETTVVQSRMVNSSYYYLVSSTATDSFEEALEEMKKCGKVRPTS